MRTGEKLKKQHKQTIIGSKTTACRTNVHWSDIYSCNSAR